MTGDKGKRILIHLSSSDDSGGEDDTASFVSVSSSEDECALIDGDDDDEDEDGDEELVGDDQQSLSDQVLYFLQERHDLQELSLKECKAYLRRNGLRVSGNKNDCVQRIQEHWRIKDGKAEVLYPRSSFVINCTGDVCKGDIVLFTQKVYGSFDKVTRKGKHMGRRTVGGRVVKESYGAAKQQHTFTVEVLWSKGIKKLPPLYPLLVKGRNLYRLKTYRQPWKNEGERRKVLAEKHRRGTAARLKRAKRQKGWSTDKVAKVQKVSRGAKAFQLSCSKGGKHCGSQQEALTSKHLSTKYNERRVNQGATRHNAKAKFSNPFPRHQELVFQEDFLSSQQSYHSASQRYPNLLAASHRRILPFASAIEEFQREVPYHGPIMMPAVQYNGLRDSSFLHNSCHFRSPWIPHANSRQCFPTKTAHGQGQNGLLVCSIRGCKEPRSDRCVIAACWSCCRREGLRCNIHR